MSPYRHFPIQSREGQRTGASEQISSRFPHHFHVRNQDHDQLRGLQWRRRRSSLIIRQARLLLFFSLLLSQFLDVIFLFSPDSLQTPTALLPQISPLLVQASPRYVSTTTACFIVSTKPTRANSNYRHPGQCRFSSKTQSKPTTIIPSTTTQSRTNVGISNRSDDAATAAAADENGAVVPPNGAKTVLPQAAGEAAIRTVQWLGERLTGSSLRTPPSRLSSFVRSNEANVALRYESNTRRRPQLFALADDGDSLDPDMMSSLISSSTPATSTISPTNQSKLLQKSTQSSNKSKNSNKNDRVQGIGGSLYRPDRDDQTVLPNETLQFASTKPPVGLRNLRQQFKNKSFKNYNKEQQQQQMEMEQLQVWEALSSLEKDMQVLDRLAGQKPQLSWFELTLLLGAVASCAGSPLMLHGRLTEFIAPSAAAFTAAIGIAAEYSGRVAVADGKEVAATSLQCAAEAEGFLASAERAKAITPLCVGVGATAATLALLVPVLLDSLGVGSNLQLVTEIYLLCPLVAVLAAAVAGLALQETKGFCNQAIGVGNRRFARSGTVSRTWLSSTELIDRKSRSATSKWRSFSLSVLPAPVIGVLCPGALPTKTIVVAALAAAESAYFLARAEAMLARATDAVALKSRSAAVSDTYANQGARSAAILPFTSALSGLCAAATAAIVELPFVEALAGSSTLSGTILEILTVSAFPAMSAMFAAAAQVSKARCEVDAEAAMQAASTIALPYTGDENDPILRPWRGVLELIQLTLSNSIMEPLRRLARRMDVRRRWKFVRKNLTFGWTSGRS